MADDVQLSERKARSQEPAAEPECEVTPWDDVTSKLTKQFHLHRKTAAASMLLLGPFGALIAGMSILTDRYPEMFAHGANSLPSRLFKDLVSVELFGLFIVAASFAVAMSGIYHRSDFWKRSANRLSSNLRDFVSGVLAFLAGFDLMAILGEYAHVASGSVQIIMASITLLIIVLATSVPIAAIHDFEQHRYKRLGIVCLLFVSVGMLLIGLVKGTFGA